MAEPKSDCRVGEQSVDSIDVSGTVMISCHGEMCSSMSAVLDVLFSALVVAPAVVGYWRGTWLLAELYIAPEVTPLSTIAHPQKDPPECRLFRFAPECCDVRAG
jgi:hypothetical protein